MALISLSGHTRLTESPAAPLLLSVSSFTWKVKSYFVICYIVDFIES